MPGSSPPLCAGRQAGPVEGDTLLSVSVHLRARPDSPGLGWVNRQALRAPAERVVLTRAQFAERHGALGSDVDEVRAWLEGCGLRVDAVHPGRRRIVASGTALLMQRAFAVGLCVHRGGGGEVHLGRKGALVVPSGIAPLLRAVLGLDGCLRVRWDDGRASADSLVCAVAAPGAASERALVDAVIDTVHDPSRRALLVVLGFGAPEAEWSVQGMRVVEQTLFGAGAMGVSVVAACREGERWYPASARHAIASAAVWDAADELAAEIRRTGYPLGGTISALGSDSSGL
ncbi:MAG TPA: protease pro-enzyme activation domain-containing protein [Candidatus Dormibacteraeota bacterium]|nr:protease pro-enzyme activation domain-containing protein [Candidatus Dormibacteraeota bacterium]